MFASDPDLQFDRVYLGAPYFLPRLTVEERSLLTRELTAYGKRLTIAWGTEDEWPSTIRDVRNQLGDSGWVRQELQGFKHEASLSQAVQFFWGAIECALIDQGK